VRNTTADKPLTAPISPQTRPIRYYHGMTILTLRHVSKQFAQSSAGGLITVHAVRDISFKLTSGTVLALLGPSGCGKSTLLRLIAGLVKPDSGEILYDNIPLNDIPLPERGIGMVFQEGALFPHWETRRTVGFFLWLRHREHEVPERVAHIARITGFGLELLLDRLPRELSGGERQRVAIARALARDPRIFLFDEPFSNLDAKLRAQARLELKRLLHAFPVTSVYVTHDQVEAVALADRIAVMQAGAIEQIDHYQGLYDNPINLFVATFIGVPTINLFRGTIWDHRWYGQAFGGVPIRSDLPDGTEVILGVRPEGIQLADEGFAARIETIVPHFAERQLQLEATTGCEALRLLVPLGTSVAPGDRVSCAFNLDALLFFDPVSGKRIG
jgi:ABC-type sugar transport system ATPase subunit